MKRPWLLLGLVFLFQPMYGQETEEKEKILSITDDRRELLLYGIDNQVIELIGDLSDEKDKFLSGEVLAAYKLTRNPKVRSEILKYFTNNCFIFCVLYKSNQSFFLYLKN